MGMKTSWRKCWACETENGPFAYRYGVHGMEQLALSQSQGIMLCRECDEYLTRGDISKLLGAKSDAMERSDRGGRRTRPARKADGE